MKQRFLKLSQRLDALSLRERTMVFAAAVATVVFLVYHAFLGPLYARDARLRAQIAQQHATMTGIGVEMTELVNVYGSDPDAANKAKLAQLTSKSETLGANLRSVQKGLVAPQNMAPLLESLLKGNGRLRLLSLKTLPVTGISEAPVLSSQPSPASPNTGGTPTLLAAPVAPAAPAAPVVKPPELLYRHAVEITVQGNYLDMINYMNALESLPTQLFWGNARLEVEEHPVARLTLTLYTLSLDKKWMKL